jgi:hypothetical protein
LAEASIADVVAWLQQDLLSSAKKTGRPSLPQDRLLQKAESSLEEASRATKSPDVATETRTDCSSATATLAEGHPEQHPKETPLEALASLLRTTCPDFVREEALNANVPKEAGTTTPIAQAQQIIRVNVRLTNRKSFRKILDWTLDDYVQSALSIQTWNRRFLMSVHSGVTPHTRIDGTLLRQQEQKQIQKILDDVVMKSPASVKFSWIAVLERVLRMERMVRLPQTPPLEFLEQRRQQAASKLPLRRATPRFSRRPWTSDENKLLLEKFRVWGQEWEKIAAALPGRSPLACRDRLHRLLGSK